MKRKFAWTVDSGPRLWDWIWGWTVSGGVLQLWTALPGKRMSVSLYAAFGLSVFSDKALRIRSWRFYLNDFIFSCLFPRCHTHRHHCWIEHVYTHTHRVTDVFFSLDTDLETQGIISPLLSLPPPSLQLPLIICPQITAMTYSFTSL